MWTIAQFLIAHRIITIDDLEWMHSAAEFGLTFAMPHIAG